ncbi:hypothetical protein ACQP2F_28480 [Actinoplanes sp. CA-030573]|uniref:hypothetical protein n=1 Tax=Actinoplanes sp. CA-030573 TaxID=3239898 RepID=UPI003D91E312
MTDSIGGLPFWDLVFDSDGDPDPAGRDALFAELPAQGITDLYVFSHGWNNSRSTARRLYDGFLGLLAGQLIAAPTGKPGLAGVYWPSLLWSDEPIPNFDPAPPMLGVAGGAAAAVPQTPMEPVPPTVDDQTLAGLLEQFPEAKDVLERAKALLDGPPTDEARSEFFDCLKEFAARAGTPDDDGEHDGATPPAEPRMLQDDDPTALYERYRDALTQIGVPIPGDGDGQAGIGDAFRGIWNGAKEALRGATYWQMKNRAGVVGRNGLGPLLGGLATRAPGLRIHLIGHSFGARLVSYALDGLPASMQPSPVKSVTLVEGAFSHFVFARPLPFDAGRGGALAGRQQRVDGPIVSCFSVHDHALGTFYPLASLAAGDAASAGHDKLYRWGAIGHDGAQNGDAVLDAVQAAGSSYHFSRDHILNVDCSAVVSRGGAPSGAHSDIVHPEVTGIVLAASRT